MQLILNVTLPLQLWKDYQPNTWKFLIWETEDEGKGVESRPRKVSRNLKAEKEEFELQNGRQRMKSFGFQMKCIHVYVCASTFEQGMLSQSVLALQIRRHMRQNEWSGENKSICSSKVQARFVLQIMPIPNARSKA